MSNATTTPVFIDAANLSLLRGLHVYLEFLTEGHREILRPLARDERIWEFTKTLLITDAYDQQFDNYFNEALAIARDGGQGFAIIAAADRRVIGMTRVYDVERKVKRATIGHTWYVPDVWGKVYNKECKLLLLQYIFETLGFVRAELRVASQNIRSQKAVAKIGGVKEAVLRKYALRGDGTQSDTVIFSILDEEWLEKKERLLGMVAGARV
jgi:RimJ/RimL family protein N-acetyltransferase